MTKKMTAKQLMAKKEELGKRLNEVVTIIHEMDRRHLNPSGELMKIAEEWRCLERDARRGNRLPSPDRTAIIASLINATGKTSSKDLKMFFGMADDIMASFLD